MVKHLSEDLYGMRLGRPNGVFEVALLAICLQMAPPKRSNQMMDCLIEKYGDTAVFGDRNVRFWPAPALMAGVDETELKGACLLGYRAKYVVQTARILAEGFPDVLGLSAMGREEAVTLLKRLPGLGDYAARIVSPHPHFPLDVWSARIFHEIMFGTTPPKPREMVRKVTEAARARWGEYAGYVFVYVLHDLPRLRERYQITRLA